MNWLRSCCSNWLEKHLGGHISVGPITIYGFNAMHIAVNIQTRRWGYLCFHPGVKMFGRKWPWYFYISPNATPWASTFAIGPGVDRLEKRLSTLRRWLLGHGYSTSEWNDFTHWLKEQWEKTEHFVSQEGETCVPG